MRDGAGGDAKRRGHGPGSTVAQAAGNDEESIRARRHHHGGSDDDEGSEKGRIEHVRNSGEAIPQAPGSAFSCQRLPVRSPSAGLRPRGGRSEEHTSELQSLMRISYAVFFLKKKIKIKTQHKP